MRNSPKKLALAMLSMLLVTSLLSSLTVTPSSAADYANIGVKVGDWAHYEVITDMPGSEDATDFNFTVVSIDRCNVTALVVLYNASGTIIYQLSWSNISDGTGPIYGESYLWLYLVVPNLVPNEPLWIDSLFLINETVTIDAAGVSRECNHFYADEVTFYAGTGNVDSHWDKATGLGVTGGYATDLGFARWNLTSTSLWKSPQDYMKVGVQVGDWAHYSLDTNTPGSEGFTNLNVTIIEIDRCNVTASMTMYNATVENTDIIWGNVSSGESGGFIFLFLLVVPNLTEGDPLCINIPVRINYTRTMITGGKARVCNHLNLTEGGYTYDISWDQATGIGVRLNVSVANNHVKWNLISTSLWSPPDYTKVGVQVGDWAHYSFYTNVTGKEGFTNLNVTIIEIDRSNVTASMTMYNATVEETEIIWGNLSSGQSGGFPFVFLLVAPNLTEGDPLCINFPLWINYTGAMITGGKARVCNHLNVTQVGSIAEIHWDQVTGIGVKLYVNMTNIHMRWDLISTSLWSPPDYTKVGVHVGDWMFYSMIQTVPPLNAVNISITQIDRCNVTLFEIAYNASGPIAAVFVWGNLSDGSYGPLVSPFPVWLFLVSRDLGSGDLLYIDAPFWVNDSVTMFVFGESRTCNHLHLDAVSLGSYTASMDLYWDSATGVSVKGDLNIFGLTRSKWNLTSTSLWSPAPTIAQPAAVTYAYGTTGHSITWNPLSQVPRNYTITRDGAEVASADWNGESVTCSVDGLAIGAYTYTCTVCDTIYRRASSSVIVTVNPPAPTIDQPATIAYTYGTTGHNITWNPSSLIPYNYTITRNGTIVVSKTWAGEAITISADGLEVGTYVYNCTVYDTMGRRVSSTVTVTVNALAPTIDQPATITYTYGTTGHSITWNPSSLAPYNYTITRNGAIVSSGNWNGQAITISVDGLEAGTYMYNCTVWDTNGRHVSSTVTVTVTVATSTAPPPQPLPVELLVGIVVSIVAVVIIAAVVVLRKRSR